EAGAIVVAGAQWRVERDRVVRGARLHRLEHLFDREVQLGSDLLGRGRAAERARQALDGLVDLQHALLHAAGHVERPAGVAEVALQLTEDRRHGVARKARTVLRLEAVDRLDEADRGNLHEVVERLAGALVAPREPAGKRQEALDELLSGEHVALRLITAEQQLVALECAYLWVSITCRRPATGRRFSTGHWVCVDGLHLTSRSSRGEDPDQGH